MHVEFGQRYGWTGSAAYGTALLIFWAWHGGDNEAIRRVRADGALMKKSRLARILAVVILAVVAVSIVNLYLNRPTNRIEASGTIETTEVDVSFQVAGKVQELLVQEGDHVTQGQVAARGGAREDTRSVRFG
jgi:multidrug efflux pump subunit AcrA (membrane-fusion protein)